MFSHKYDIILHFYKMHYTKQSMLQVFFQIIASLRLCFFYWQENCSNKNVILISKKMHSNKPVCRYFEEIQISTLQ